MVTVVLHNHANNHSYRLTQTIGIVPIVVLHEVIKPWLVLKRTYHTRQWWSTMVTLGIDQSLLVSRYVKEVQALLKQRRMPSGNVGELRPGGVSQENLHGQY